MRPTFCPVKLLRLLNFKSEIPDLKTVGQNEKRPVQQTSRIRKSKIADRRLRCNQHVRFFLRVVHKQIFLPLRTRLRVVAEKYVVEAKTQELL